LTKNSGMGSPVKLMAAAAGSVGGTDARAQLARLTGEITSSVFEARAAAKRRVSHEVLRRRYILENAILRDYR
jgi:hypothetical protein